MYIKNNWLRSFSFILAVALLLTAVGSNLQPGQDMFPFISGFVNASPDQQLTELQEAQTRPDQANPGQYMEFEPDAEDGKVSVIIGFTGAPARGAQRRATLAQQKTLVENFGGEVKRDFTIINAVTARLPLQAIEALSKHHEVSYLEPDYKVTLTAQETPWGIDRIFGPEKYTFSTWDHSRGRGIAVAVLDTGIDENHIDLGALLGGVNTIDSTHWGSDGHGHGTHVAGTIAAIDNNAGVVGAAPDAGLYAVKVLNDDGGGTYSSVIAGIEWAFNKSIPVINMSLGGGMHSSALKDAVDAAYAGGTLLVAAAGNDGDSTDNVLYPARYSSVIAVSASDSNDKLASFSSRGPSIEFIAPGVSILSLYPGNYMVRWSGTSMATPHVAGSVALLWGANPDLSSLEVRNILRQTAEDLGLSSDHQGYGLVRNDLAVAQALLSLSSNADLSTLTVNEGTLNPVFDSSITYYTVNVADEINSIDITPTLSATSASMTINDVSADCSEPKTIVLGDAGTTTLINIEVIAENEDAKTYIINVSKVDATERVAGVSLYNQEDGLFYIIANTFDSEIFSNFSYGSKNNNWLPIAGDWNGSGVAGVALYDQASGTFYVKDDTTPGPADRKFRYGPKNNDWMPVAGDWNGNGLYGVALYDQQGGRFLVKDDSQPGWADREFRYGPKGNDWIPVAGDWNGNGLYGVALYDQQGGRFLVKDDSQPGWADREFRYGPRNNDWFPVAGDWNGNWVDGVALYNQSNGTFYVKDETTPGPADRTLKFGPLNNKWLPAGGNW